ncbi:unnamed protein product [Linum trigynum]|uniref:Uncharacterized protein n=1 Tax=Linum trigynum TaxID=586398 RepID=A0AAV2EKR8_9ROSI
MIRPTPTGLRSSVFYATSEAPSIKVYASATPPPPTYTATPMHLGRPAHRIANPSPSLQCSTDTTSSPGPLANSNPLPDPPRSVNTECLPPLPLRSSGYNLSSLNLGNLSASLQFYGATTWVPPSLPTIRSFITVPSTWKSNFTLSVIGYIRNSYGSTIFQLKTKSPMSSPNHYLVPPSSGSVTSSAFPRLHLRGRDNGYNSGLLAHVSIPHFSLFCS